LLSAARRVKNAGGRASVSGASGAVALAYQALSAGSVMPHHRDLASAFLALGGIAEVPVSSARAELVEERKISATFIPRSVEKYLAFDATGTLDSSTSDLVEKGVATPLASKRPVIVNLSGTDYVSSSGWAAIIQASVRFREAGVAFAVVGLHDAIKLSFNHLGVEKLVATFRTESDAVLHLEDEKAK